MDKSEENRRIAPFFLLPFLMEKKNELVSIQPTSIVEVTSKPRFLVPAEVAQRIPKNTDRINALLKKGEEVIADDTEILRLIGETHADVMDLIVTQSGRIVKGLENTSGPMRSVKEEGAIFFQQGRNNEAMTYLDHAGELAKHAPSPLVRAGAFQQLLIDSIPNIEKLTEVKIKRVSTQSEMQDGFDEFGVVTAEVTETHDELEETPRNLSDEEKKALAMRNMFGKLSDRDLNTLLIHIYGFDHSKHRRQGVEELFKKKASKFSQTDAKFLKEAVDHVSGFLDKLANREIPDPYRVSGGAYLSTAELPEPVRLDSSKDLRTQIVAWLNTRPESKKTVELDDRELMLLPQGPQRCDCFDGTIVVVLNNGQMLELKGSLVKEGEATTLEKRLADLVHAENPLDRPAGMYAYDAAEVARAIRYLGVGEEAYFKVGGLDVCVFRDENGVLDVKGVDGLPLPPTIIHIPTDTFKKQFLDNPLSHASALQMEFVGHTRP